MQVLSPLLTLCCRYRYDHLISQLIAPTAKVEPICAFGVQISIECIAASLAAFQSTSVTNLVKEQRSFGYWSARRCDVYIVSFQPGHLYERLEVAALLWQHGISADLMYESGVADANLESFTEICHREGILCVVVLLIIRFMMLIDYRFTVYPRPRTARREMSDFKVKSVLRGTEYEGAKVIAILLQSPELRKHLRSITSRAGRMAGAPYL